MRVIVADDQEVVRRVLGHVLGEAGHEVVAAVGDGREAFLAARELRPEAVVLDLGMPGVDGIATLRLLHDAEPDLRIVVHTAYDDALLTEALGEAGASAVVVKSSDPAPLLDALGETARI